MNAAAPTDSTRTRVLREAMRLFGEQGYAATPITQIEAAAGLTAGAGGLYRHFPSKAALLEAGIRSELETRADLLTYLSDPASLAELPLRDRLTAVATAALSRLDAERNLNRVILRDLRDLPELQRLVRDDELRAIGTGLSKWLKHQFPETPDHPADSDKRDARNVDWDATAAALMGAVSHYWVLRDSMGEHPSGIDEERYIAAVVELVMGLATGHASDRL